MTTTEPRFIINADETFDSSNGAHHRLRVMDPLHLTNNCVLHNMTVGGDQQALEASCRRLAAFHEAGHLWAAHGLGLRIEPVRLSTPTRPVRTYDAAQALTISAAGPLAISVAMEADTCEFIDLKTDFGTDFGDHMLRSRYDNEPPRTVAPQHQQRRSETYRQHVAHWHARSDLCLRGGDTQSERLVMSLEVLDVFLPGLLSEWWGVDRLARRLLAGTMVTAIEVGDLLSDPGNRH